VGDEFVRPDASGDAGDYGSLGCWVVVLGQFVFVGDEGHHVSEHGGRLLDDVDVLFGLFEFGVAVDSSDAGLSYPFTVDVVGFDLAFERIPVGELEVPDFGVVRVFEEDGLTVSAVLDITLAIINRLLQILSRLTLPVAPQHASRASNITTSWGIEAELCSTPPSFSKRWRAMLAPVIPLPMITTSAEDGRPLVDLWPRSSGDGLVCQNESVDFGVGRPAGWLSLGRSGMVRAIVVGRFVVGDA
jgi:hypothetical protein